MKINVKTLFFSLIVLITVIIISAFILGNTAQVVIDPGHGGKDVGAEYGGRFEKNDNLALALLVEEELDKMGVDVVLTRDDDSFVSLEKRCRIANFKRAQLFVSLHRNSAADANGVEIWVSSNSPEVDTELAQSIISGLAEAGISKNRGVKSGYAQGDGDYYVNSHTNMPSCLVELGFISSDEDNALYDKNIEGYAKAIAAAVAELLENE